MNSLKVLVMAAATVAAATACTRQPEKPTIGRQVMTIDNRRLTPEVLWTFGRLAGARVSPDGTQVLYSVTYPSIKDNRTNTEWFVVQADGGEARQITHTDWSEQAAKWIDGGRKIAFLSAESGSMQLWVMRADGTGRRQVSDVEGGISDFLFSPDEKKVLYIADVKYGERTVDIYPDLDKAQGFVVDELMYKHWDEWVTSVPHPFLAEYDGKRLSKGVDLLEGEPYECPMKPFGGVEQLAFSPDGRTIAYTCRKKTGKDYAESTNSDIYLYDIATHTTQTNLTAGMMGYDINPVFSPDGRYIAWESMERDGYESDKNRLFIADLLTGERTDLTAAFDQSVACLCWDARSEHIYFISVQHGTTQIYQTDRAGTSIIRLTEGQHDYQWIGLSANGLVGIRHSMSCPNELYTIDPTGLQRQLTFENKHLLDQVEMGRVEERWIDTTDGRKMLTWVVYPPGFDPSRKYPALLYCQGGPQSPVSQFWSYRWNLQLMAANGYIVVAPNRRGLYGFGQEWLEQISGDYGGQNMLDYLAAIDAVAADDFVDNERMGCVGASYGGFSVYWLAGHHDKRFKAFIAHDGIFNLEQQYVETDELWFPNWDLGGAYWDENPVAQRTYANSPHRFVDRWDTPILCIHGERDYRILASQGMSAFNAARMRDIPAELLIFPDENHWVTKPQNGILWQRVFFRWLDRWLKD